MGLDWVIHKTETLDFGSRIDSYGGFHDFREILAGLEGSSLEGFFDGSMDSDSALAPLLNHSDCDGDLYLHEIEKVLPRLKQIRSDKPELAEGFYQVLDVVIDVMQKVVELADGDPDSRYCIHFC